jgi:secreted Zn-dependent insulinase-like peptidase
MQHLYLPSLLAFNRRWCSLVSLYTAVLQTPAAYASPESAVCVRLLVKLLGDYLNEVAYPAELAGLSYSITNHLAGFQVSNCLVT